MVRYSRDRCLLLDNNNEICHWPLQAVLAYVFVFNLLPSTGLWNGGPGILSVCFQDIVLSYVVFFSQDIVRSYVVPIRRDEDEDEDSGWWMYSEDMTQHSDTHRHILASYVIHIILAEDSLSRTHGPGSGFDVTVDDHTQSPDIETGVLD